MCMQRVHSYSNTYMCTHVYTCVHARTYNHHSVRACAHTHMHTHTHRHTETTPLRESGAQEYPASIFKSANAKALDACVTFSADVSSLWGPMTPISGMS